MSLRFKSYEIFQLGRLERLRLVLFWHFCDKSDDSPFFCNAIYFNKDGSTQKKPRRTKKSKSKEVQADIIEDKAEISTAQELFANPKEELANLVFDKCCEYLVVSGSVWNKRWLREEIFWDLNFLNQIRIILMSVCSFLTISLLSSKFS